MFLAAPPDDRLFERQQPSKLAAKDRFTFVLLICLLLHAIPIALVVYFDRSDDDLAPGEQAIPVEMIAEPPPPKEPDPPAPKSEQQPKEATLDEKIATDAPRAANDEKVVKDAKDEATHSPKAAPEEEPAKIKPANESAQAPEKTSDAKPAEASAPQSLDHRADGDPVEAAEVQRPDTQKQAKAEQAAPAWQTYRDPTPNPLAAIAAVPDYSIAPASRNAPIAGGKAASTYLSIIYGLVMARMHSPETAAGRAQTSGEIDFSLDLSGRLLRERLVKSCGSPELDSAAMAAIRAAAPFPPPPTGTGISLNLHYGK
jgi:protein TonB